MKYLIAGLGSIGRRHLKNLIALNEKDIILYRSRLSTLPDEELKGFQVETDIKTALAHKPDAVIISNPTSMHLDMAIPAAKAGCHIFLEKPISHSLERISELKNALEQGKGNLLVGFQYRFHPTLKVAYQLLKEGTIGKTVSVCSHWGEYLPDWHPWENYKSSYASRSELGGGVVLTLCHPFDYLSWLFGKPEVLWAHIDTIGDLGINVEDIADVCLQFPQGAIATVHLDYLQKPASHTLEIIGTKGTMRWNNEDGLLSIYQFSTDKWEYFLPPKEFERNTMFLDQMGHFISVVCRKAQPLCTLDDGITALEIALKTLSSKTGGSYV